MAKAGDRNGLIMRTLKFTDGLMRIVVGNGRFPSSDSFGDYTKEGFDLNEWHMITFSSGSFDNGDLNGYFDGELLFTWPAARFKVNSTMQVMPLQLGIDQYARWYPLNGMPDEIRVYNRELSSAEVRLLYAAILNPPRWPKRVIFRQHWRGEP